MSYQEALLIKELLDTYTAKNELAPVTNIELRSNFNVWSVVLNIVPFILIGFVVFYIFKNATNQNSKAFDFAKNRAKLNREKISHIQRCCWC